MPQVVEYGVPPWPSGGHSGDLLVPGFCLEYADIAPAACRAHSPVLRPDIYDERVHSIRCAVIAIGVEPAGQTQVPVAGS